MTEDLFAGPDAVRIDEPANRSLRLGGGWCVLVGAPVLLGSLDFVFGSWHAGGFAVCLGMGGVAVTLGVLLFGWRRGVVVADDAVRAWWGFYRPYHVEEVPLERFTRVAVSRERRASQVRGRTRTRIVHRVRLVAREGQDLTALVAREEDAAREAAQRLAQATGLPLDDRTG